MGNLINMLFREILGEFLCPGEKRAKTCKQMIEAGNEAFVAGDDDLAMQSYNQVRHKIRKRRRTNYSYIPGISNSSSRL